MQPKRLLLASTALVYALSGANPILAQRSPAPTQQEFLDALDPPGFRAQQPSAPLTRGIRIGPPGGNTTEGGGAGANRPAPAINIRVPFNFDSATLTPEGIAILTPLGRALSDPRLADARLRIVGHTDARGADDYNQTLSERRAAAVRGFLLGNFGIDSARIEALGRGRRELLDPANPGSEVNRRVQVIRLD